MNVVQDLLGLGLEPKDLSVIQMCLRGVLVFLVTIAMVRVGHKRFLSRMTAVDVVLGFILASALSRAINGSAPFFPTLAVGFVLVLLHRLLTAWAFYWEGFGKLVKGEPDVLVHNGKVERKKLERHKVSEQDLLEEARLNGKIDQLDQIRTAVLERNGQISVIPAEKG